MLTTHQHAILIDLGKYNTPGPAQNAHNTSTRHTYRPR